MGRPVLMPLLGLVAAGHSAPAACQTASDERPDTLVNLATVQSGPRVQADELDGAIQRSPATRPCWPAAPPCAWPLARPPRADRPRHGTRNQ